MSLTHAMILNRPERWGAFFVCCCVLGVLLLRNWGNSFAPENQKYGIVIGIDLGDEYARVAYYKDSTKEPIEIVKDEQGNNFIPSCVAFTDKGDVLVGYAAQLMAETNPQRTICDVRKLLGTKSPLAQSVTESPHYEVAEGQNAKPVVQVNIGGRENTYSPEYLTGMMLSKLREMAEAHIDKKITHAVVSVPHIDDHQKQAIKDAGTNAGLKVLRVVNNYIAAGIGYRLDGDVDERNAMVLHMGGDNLQVTVLEIDIGVFDTLHTTSTSLVDEATVERLHGDTLLKVAMKHVKEALEKTNLGVSDIDDIILTGSSSFIPTLRSALQEFFGKEPATDLQDEAVVVGIAKYGTYFSMDDASCIGCHGELRLNLLSLSIETSDGLARPIILRNSVTPVRKSQTFLTTSEEPSAVVIRIYEGERIFARDNRLLGELKIDAVPAGVPVEVMLEIDANFMMHAKATSLGKSVSLSNLNHTTEYDADVIDRTFIEAESLWEADHVVAEPLDAQRDLYSYILAVQKLVEGPRGQSSNASGRTIQDAVRNVRAWLSQADESTGAQDFYKQKDVLTHALGELAEGFKYEQVYRVGGPMRFDERKHHDEL